MTTCDKAKKGWECLRKPGHAGPCAAIRIPWYKRLAQAIGEALGQAKFGE